MSLNRVLYIDWSKSPANTTNLTVTGTMQVNGGTITASPTGTTTAQVTNTTTVNPVSIRCEDTTGTVFVNCGPTQISATSGTINSITMPSLTFTSGTVNSATISSIPALTFTSGTVGNTVTISPTGTQSINLANVLGAALTTANPVLVGGRASTDTTASVANGAAVEQMFDKWGRTVVVPAVQDMWATGTFTLTATTASTPTGLAAPGANYRWALTGIYACSTANALTRLDVRDNTTAIVPFVWVQTATTAGEPKCWQVNFNPPFLITANQPITVALATAVTDVRGVISAYKTGT